MAKILVKTSAAVMYDGDVYYKSDVPHTVEDTYENYLKSLKDITNGVIDVTESFANTLPPSTSGGDGGEVDYSPQISALDTRLESVESAQTDYQTGITQNASDITSLSSRISTVESQQDTDSAAIQNINSTISSHTSSIATHTTQISALTNLTSKINAVNVDPSTPAVGEMWLRSDLLVPNYFYDDFSSGSLNANYWSAITVSGTPTIDVNGGKIRLDTTAAVTNQGLLIAKLPLYCNMNNQIRFRFSIADMSRSDNGQLTPIFQKYDTLPTTYDNTRNKLFFRVDETAKTVSIEQAGNTSTRQTATPSNQSNILEVTVKVSSDNQNVVVNIFDITANTSLATMTRTFTDIGLISTDKLWFVAGVDTSATLSYLYKYSLVEVSGLR